MNKMDNKEKGFFKYTCEYWDDIKCVTKIVAGIVLADTFINAMDRIIKIYGENNINKISLSVDEDFYSDAYEFKNKRKEN